MAELDKPRTAQELAADIAALLRGYECFDEDEFFVHPTTQPATMKVTDPTTGNQFLVAVSELP